MKAALTINSRFQMSLSTMDPTSAYNVDRTYWQDGKCPALSISLYPQGATYISGDSPDFIHFDHLSSASTLMQETGRCLSDPSTSPDRNTDDWLAVLDLLTPVDLASGFNAAASCVNNHIQSLYNTPVMAPIAAQSLTPQLQHEAVTPPNQPARKRRQVTKQNLNLTV